MGALNPTPSPTGGAPVSPDATDENLVAARRARAFSLFQLGRGYAGNFTSNTNMGTKGTTGAVTYGQTQQQLLGGATQFGDEQGATQAPAVGRAAWVPGQGYVAGTSATIDPTNPNAPPPGAPGSGKSG